MRDRLIELFKKIEKEPAITCPAYKTDKTCKDCKYSINDSLCNHIERQVDYLLANGVVAPPYSIGSKVYSVINSMTLPIPIGVYECEIQRYVLTQHGISAIVKFKKGSVTYGDIPKDVSELHLTREEAGRAFKGAKE